MDANAGLTFLELILSLIGAVIVGAGTIWSFQAFFKSGKKEARIDAKLTKLIDDPDTPDAIRQAAAQIRAANLTSAAQEIRLTGKGLEDLVTAAVNQAIAKIPK